MKSAMQHLLAMFTAMADSCIKFCLAKLILTPQHAAVPARSNLPVCQTRTVTARLTVNLESMQAVM